MKDYPKTGDQKLDDKLSEAMAKMNDALAFGQAVADQCSADAKALRTIAAERTWPW